MKRVCRGRSKSKPGAEPRSVLVLSLDENGANSDHVGRSEDSHPNTSCNLPKSARPRALRSPDCFTYRITLGMLERVSELIEFPIAHAESRARFTPAEQGALNPA